jgi:hypothetical protein
MFSAETFVVTFKVSIRHPFSWPIDFTAQGGRNILPPLATPLAGFCRHDDLSTGSVIVGGILDQITDYQPLQNFSYCYSPLYQFNTDIATHRLPRHNFIKETLQHVSTPKGPFSGIIFNTS